jgi:hypothetical protein
MRLRWCTRERLAACFGSRRHGGQWVDGAPSLPEFSSSSLRAWQQRVLALGSERGETMALKVIDGAPWVGATALRGLQLGCCSFAAVPDGPLYLLEETAPGHETTALLELDVSGRISRRAPPPRPGCDPTVLTPPEVDARGVVWVATRERCGQVSERAIVGFADGAWTRWEAPSDAVVLSPAADGVWLAVGSELIHLRHDGSSQPLATNPWGTCRPRGVVELLPDDLLVTVNCEPGHSELYRSLPYARELQLDAAPPNDSGPGISW